MHVRQGLQSIGFWLVQAFAPQARANPQAKALRNLAAHWHGRGVLRQRLQR